MRFPIKGVARSLLLLALIAATPLAARAETFKAGDLEIVNPWARVPLKGTDVTDGFLKIINHGTTPDRLTAVSVGFAPVSQIHEMKMDGNVMQMQEMKDGLEIPAGATVELKPGANHIMFMQVKQQLAPNQPVKGELTFEKAGKVEIEFMVEPAGTSAPMQMN